MTEKHEIQYNEKAGRTQQTDQALHLIANTVAQDWPPEERELISRSFERAIKSTARLMTSHKNIATNYSQLAGNQHFDDAEYVTGLVTNLLEPETLTTSEALSYLEGNRRYRKMIEKAGGTYSTAQVAELLEISDGGVRKRRNRNALFGIELGNKTRYPVWQFTTGSNVIEHLSEVLNLLTSSSDSAKIRFFLTPRRSLNGSVVDALRENRDIDIVKREAATFGVHGAH